MLLHRLVPVLMEVLLSDNEISIKEEGLYPARLGASGARRMVFLGPEKDVKVTIGAKISLVLLFLTECPDLEEPSWGSQ